MKIILESTTEIVNVNGVPARVWEGKTEKGIPCFAFITRMGVHKEADTVEFERDLQECRPPEFEGAWTRHMWFLD